MWNSSDDFNHLFRLCSTQRLFLPYLLPNEKTVIYADADVLFLSPLDDLWVKLRNLRGNQLGALPECRGCHFTSKRKWKRSGFLGEYGLSAHVFLMNLQNMRKFPPGWEKTCYEVAKNNKGKLLLGDQDIMNIIFRKYSDLIYQLGCE